MRRAARPLIAILLLALVTTARAELRPENVLLVVNRNVHAGRELADFYRAARLIPADHILALDLPAGDDLSFADFEASVRAPLREALRTRHLEAQITCIVTFYGVPLRIGNRPPAPGEEKERADLEVELPRILQQVRGAVWAAEDKLRELEPAFAPIKGDDVHTLQQRHEVVVGRTLAAVAKIPDAARRAEQGGAVVAGVQKLHGPAGVVRFFGHQSPDAPEAARKEMAALAAHVADAQRLATALAQQRHDPDARRKLRDLARQAFGLFGYAGVIQSQADGLKSAESGAAFDNELALLWWDHYPRYRWQPNPLSYQLRAGQARFPRTLMTMRLDAPEPQMVRDLILNGLKTERDGLKGAVVLDSRGIKAGADTPVGSYAWYDQAIRDFAQIVTTRTGLTLVHDDKPELMPENAAKDAAVYCGWYSLRKYVPVTTLSRGAVAFHIASGEMISLHNNDERGWCANLLRAGAVATVGPVSEPYLHSFPLPNDFYPLLFTGKLPLAEVYWATNPLTSWMQTFVGDPLYTPYKANPAMKVEDLPDRLRPALQTPTTNPATAPAPH